METHEDRAEIPDVDKLVAELRARVDERRRSGAYPAGLEEDLAAHFRRILRQRAENRDTPDLHGPLQAVAEALPLGPSRIPVESDFPGGRAVHRTVGRLVGRQTQGVLEQMQALAQQIQATLAALVTTVDSLSHEVRVEVAQHIEAIYERQAALERSATGMSVDPQRAAQFGQPSISFQPWYSAERFEDEFRGRRDDMLERYRNVAERLVGSEPVLDLGCGRGEFLELLSDLGIDAHGVDLDPDLVKIALDHEVSVELGDGLGYLQRLEDSSLGGLVCIQVVEHMSAQEVVDLVALAADKIRAGGEVFLETVNPQSLYVFAHSFYLDPTHLRPVHPAYLTFLFREAGFTKVEIDWRSPPPSDDVLQELPSWIKASEPINVNVRRLNQLLFAPQDYLLVATR